MDFVLVDSYMHITHFNIFAPATHLASPAPQFYIWVWSMYVIYFGHISSPCYSFLHLHPFPLIPFLSKLSNDDVQH